MQQMTDLTMIIIIHECIYSVEEWVYSYYITITVVICEDLW